MLVISDLHGRLENIRLLREPIEFNKTDVLVVCGDLTHFGSYNDAGNILKTLADLGPPVLFVPGNCDPKALAFESKVGDAKNLHGNCVSYSDLNFIGVGGSTPGPFDTPFELTENQIQRILEDAAGKCVDKRVNIVVSHNPPYGTEVDKMGRLEHVGSKVIQRFIQSRTPLLALCGHIHEARGIDSIQSTVVVNPGPFHKNFYALADTETVALATLESFDKKG